MRSIVDIRCRRILDNDWSSTGFIPYLIALNANMTVLGLTGNTADSWALQCTLHALATLEHGNLSCIPVALGQPYVSGFCSSTYIMLTSDPRYHLL